MPFIGIGMFELTSLAKCVASSRKSVYDRLMSAPDAVPWSYTAYVAKNFYWLVFRIIFWVLALLKVCWLLLLLLCLCWACALESCCGTWARCCLAPSSCSGGRVREQAIGLVVRWRGVPRDGV